MIVSASGFEISMTNPPAPLPSGLTPNNRFLGGHEIIECQFTDANDGVCEDRVFREEDTTTLDFTETLTGSMQIEVLSVDTPSTTVSVQTPSLSFETVQTSPTAQSVSESVQVPQPTTSGGVNPEDGAAATMKVDTLVMVVSIMLGVVAIL